MWMHFIQVQFPPQVAQAYLNAEYIEDVAKIYTIARSVGTPVELKSL